MEQLAGYDGLDEIKPLTAEEKQKILIEWNNTTVEYPKDKCIHELFQEQVKRRPEKVALVFEDRALTYRELDETSTRLAKVLQKHGVNPDSPVGICLERSLQMIVGIMAILKAGAGYLPIEPDYPPTRTRYMLEDSGTKVLVTNRSLLEESEKMRMLAWEGTMVFLDAENRNAASPDIPTLHAASHAANPFNLSYIIYTSGTTGKPKGTLTKHYNVIRVVKNTNYIRLTGADRILQLSNFAFDGSVFDIYGALLNGAVLVMIEKDRVLALNRLSELISREQITVFFVTTALFNALVDLQIDCLANIRKVLFGGERVSVDHVKKALEYLGKNRIIHVYGPTETTVYATYYFINSIKEESGTIPIGKPISNTSVYILDKNQKPLPISTVGEIYIGGDGVARGYMNRPELTAEKFDHDLWDYRDDQDKRKTKKAKKAKKVPGKKIYNQKLLRGELNQWDSSMIGKHSYESLIMMPRPHPETNENQHQRVAQHIGSPRRGAPGRRRQNLYKTGDLARWLPEGDIEFLGRIDHQVKIRGFRIELGEIETVLAKHSQIREAVVIARIVNNNHQLAAYYVTRNKDKILTASEIRSYLQDKLPEYMIPVRFVSLETIPLTPSRKVDRKVLASQEIDLQSSREYAAPKTKDEITFCNIWEQLFGFKPIGIRDNFFNLGGNSLLAARLKIKVKESLGKAISIPDIYENPTIEALTVKMSRLDKEESQFPRIKKIIQKSHIPLSIQQEQVWYLCTLEPGNKAYNFQFTLRFQGKFNQGLFEACLTEIIRRHEIFWTTFPTIQGKPIQVIHEPWEVKIPVVDLRAIPGKQEREQQLEKLIKRELNITFDFTKLPLIGFKVFLLEEKEFLLLQIEHHLIHDGWSNALFLQEFKVLYEAYQKGEESPLPDLPVQFSDYATWQRKWLDGVFFQKQLDFWLNKIKGFPNTLELLTDKPRPKMQAFHGNLLRKHLPGDLYQALRMFCREKETTLFVTFFSAFAILMHFYTDQQDMLIGTGMVNRRLKETTHLIGMLVNAMALPINLSGELLFIDFLKRVQEVVLQAHENQEIPVEKIVERLSYERDPSRNPLFQVMFSFHDSPVPNMEFPDLRGEYHVIHNKTAKTDINVVCIPRAEQRIGMEKTDEEEKLEILWEYNTDIFKKETMEQMINHYMKILKEILSKYKKRISHIEMIDQNEKRKILHDFNNTEAEYPKEKCIHELFREQVKKKPEKVALVFEDQVLTYRELDETGAGLAGVLQKQGVKSDSLVGICIGRSLEIIIGIMGILKAGAGYVPVETDYPPARIKYMLEDSKVRVLLTTAKLQDKVLSEVEGSFGQSPGLSLQFINIENNLASTAAPLPSTCRVSPANLAYVIYTSGSTGRPKGVMVNHYSINRLVLNTNYLQISNEDTFLQYAPISFDAATLEIWGPLLNGARLSLAPVGRPSLTDLQDFVEKQKVTTAWLTAPLFQSMVEENIGFFKTLKAVLAGGDVLPVDAVKKLAERYRNLQIINGYGPTENTTFTCCYRVNRKTLPGYQKVPIGVPISNTTCFILDQRLKPAPIGVYGELYTGGDGLARGYLNSPELTSEKFIELEVKVEHFEGTGGLAPLLYRTGDMARWLPDGNIEFLGRIDHQVKVRGFRIECGEIETELTQHPGIREAVVIARKVRKDTQLVAYYVCINNAKIITTGAARSFLQSRLPEYMVPAAFISLEEIPLTPNGKIDRKALLKREVVLESSREYIAPRTGVEKQLARIWEEVLGAVKVGIHDNFFELGGHSLLATQIISRIHKELEVDVPISILFEAPDLESLSIAIAESDPYQFVPIGSIQRPDKLPLSYAQERLWFLAQLGYSEQYHIPQLIKITGDLDHGVLQKAIQFIVLRHESLRTGIKTVDGAAVQVIEETADIDIKKRDLSGLSKEEQDRQSQIIISEFMQKPFDLGQPSLMRVVLIKMDDNTHIFGICQHHIIFDGWSLGILIREISQAYAAYRQGEEPRLEELTIQYADYAVWQREVLTEEKLEKELKYWKNRLTGYQDLDMPTDYPRPGRLSGRGGYARFKLEKEQASQLTTLCQKKQVTLFTVFMAGVYLLLRRYSRQEDICLGMPVANRNHREIENLVGFFVNTLVIRITAGEKTGITVEQLLKKVQEEVAAGQDRQNVPFEKVVETLQPTRDLSRTPIFQVMVNYINTKREKFQFKGCTLEEVKPDHGASKFDLTFGFADQEDGPLEINIKYSRDLFREETVERMGRHLIRIINGLVKDGEKVIDEIELLTPEEKEKILVQWNKNQMEYPKDKCIHELFREQVEKTPDNIAVIGSLTIEHRAYMTYISYHELNEKAHQLAQVLMSKGVRPDTVVGIMAERSLELIIGILGILKAGGAYLPIDPEYPRERIDYILADSNANALLTTSTLTEEGKKVSRWEDKKNLQIILLDFSALPSSHLHLSPAPVTSLAYVMYTSGSTGKPKGVMIQHNSLMNHIECFKTKLEFRENWDYILLSAIVFDASIKQVFIPLTNGAKVHIYKDIQNIALLANYIIKNSINVINGIPSLIKVLIEELNEKDPGNQTACILIGGEKLDAQLTNKIKEKYKESRLINLYGPTETCVNALYYEIKEKLPGDPPLGKGLPNYEIYILDETTLLPLPIGIKGELYIGGEGLARGYLNQPELTAENFCPRRPGGTLFEKTAPPGPPRKNFLLLYRTGDLARWLPDGNIEFLGRKDRQVKVRGFRIECGEVETVLGEHPNIREAVVIARTINNTTQLAAYYVEIDKDKTLGASETRSYLQGKLPEYMIPVVFVALETIPLMPNGKVDRNALLRIEVTPESSREYVAPRTEIEKQLAKIWKEVLGAARVGIHDNFFELGGHSLLATQIISRINRELKVDVPLPKLFEAPRIESLSGVIAESKPYREAPIAAIKRPETLPLSYAQERLWFLAQLGYSEQYHVPKVMKIKGNLDEEALQNTMNFITNRHESLRTGFKSVHGVPHQVIEEAAAIGIEKIDLSELSKEEHERNCQSIIREFAQRPFALSRPPLLRVILVKLSSDIHILGICMHHIISDGWSGGILTREITRAYASYQEGKGPDLEGLKIQYADYALWQRETMTEERLDKELSCWKEHLSGYEDLDLPTDFPRPRQISGKGAHVKFSLQSEEAKQLKKMCQKSRMTLFTVFIASVYLLLKQYSRQEDICLGMPVANRNHREIEDLVGFFVNTLVIRIDTTGKRGITAGQLLKEVQDEIVAAQDRQNVPFEKVVETIQPTRDLSRTPIFQVLVNYVNTGREELQFVKSQLETMDFDYGISKFDLIFDLADREDGSLRMAIQYSRDLYGEETIKKMGEHLVKIISSLAKEPWKAADEIELLKQEEKQKLLIQWNNTAARYPKDQRLHELFGKQVKKTPEKVAVVFENQTLTYRELDEKSDQLACLLIEQGVKPDTFAAIMTERSLEIIIGILGILKAGGAYFPIDPDYPRERIDYMLKDSGAKILLTSHEIARLHSPRTLKINPKDTSVHPSALLPFYPSQSLSLAYLIYTSGSTGKPKGVMQTHQTITNLIEFQKPSNPISPAAQTHVAQFAAHGFDVSIQEIFYTFFNGGVLYMLAEETKKSPTEVICFVNSRHINILYLPTAYLEYFSAEVNHQKDIGLKSLEKIIVAGEALKVLPLIKDFFTAYPHILLENQYGPSETHVVTRYILSETRDQWQYLPSIGRPIANIKIYILNPVNQPVPVGVPGELHIAGDGLARGYLNNPGLTSEKFIELEVKVEHFEGTRGLAPLLYRTGDLARWLPEGNIAFSGRIDHQVKVRGFRIECGEIEAELAQHPRIREAVVIARTINNTIQLVAYYVVVDKDTVIEVNEIRNYLQQKLPDYMIPAAFVSLEAIPLTANGKVDRKTLHKQEIELESSREYLAPRTETQAQLAKIWKDVLDVERIGVHDNFFELGGHSLLATRVISRINRELAVDVPLRKLFEAPSLEDLAGVIEESKPYQVSPIVSIQRPEPLPLSYAQERLWFLVRMGLSETYHLARVVKIRGNLDREALQKTMNVIARRHESLRTAFKTVDNKAVQVIDGAVDLRIEQEDLSQLGNEEQERESQTILQDFRHRPFDLEKAPLMRVVLIKMDENTHIFGTCQHHIISDGWSMGILIKEVRQAYASYLAGREPGFEKLAVQYADYAVWQRQWFQGEVLEKQVFYWKKQLHGAPPLLKLPTDRPRPLTQTYTGAAEGIILPKALSDALKDLSQHEGVTLFMTLLAAFKVLLHRYTGEDDIVVGSPIAGRNQAEIEGLIGFFLNSLVLRTDLSGHPGFHEVLARVREVTLGAYAHQDLPFEKLLEELQPERTLSHTPLFQVFFNMLNLGDVGVEFPGLEVEPIMPSKVESKFDLTLYVREQEEEIHFSLVYNVDLFEKNRMVEMLEQYRYLLEQAAAKPREKIDSFSLVTDRAGAVLPNPLQELDGTWEGAVHTQFSRQAQRCPERPAVRDKYVVFTYSELETASSQLANYLLQNDIRVHDVVAIYAHRSASLVWAVLGVLKAGAAFLILDPVYPDSRLLDYLVQARPRGFIHLETAGELPAAIKNFLSNSSCCCGVELPQRLALAQTPLANCPTHNPQVKVDADDLAYIAFTSGSTGKPKGILGLHGSLSHFLPWMQKRFGLQGTDRYSMLSGLSHDPLQRDIFTPLWLGATICVPDPDDIEAGRLADWIKRTEINIAHLTPAMGQLLTREASDLPSLRYAFFVGDALTRGDVLRLREIAPAVTCVNLYGSTETQRAVGYFVVPPAESEETPELDWKEVLPLGRGMKDVQLLVLNHYKQLAGIGEIGEIFVRSPHLSKGYLGDEKGTYERFIGNPFSNQAGDRLYGTGDLGRFLPDGNVEFVGRKDNQVKVRGFRIELGEIEILLNKLPTIQKAVVIARSVKGNTQLIAYYVPGDKDKTPEASEIRGYLKDKLPEYMIPAAFVSLEAIPLTPNRKIDRKALQNREVELESSQDYVAPQTETEKQLARIWEEVLGVEKVGIHDNFFELGGHSLLAIQMVTGIREQLGVECPLRNIFDHATVNQLAELFPAQPVTLAENHNLTDVNIPEKNIKPNTFFPLSSGQLMPWMVWLSTKNTWNLYRIYDVRGPIDDFCLEQAFNILLERHQSIWACFTPWRPLQKIIPPERVHYSVIDLRGQDPGAGKDILEETIRDAVYTRFDLTSPPLLRLSVIQHEDHQFKLVLAAPHIVMDNTVFHTLFDELIAFYRAFASGQPLPPKQVEVKLSDYVYWEHDAAKQARQKEIDYWQQKLGTASLLYVPDSYLLPPDELALPHYIKVDSTLLDALAKFSRQHKVSLQMSLSAVIAIVLNRITSQSDICISLIVDKRLHQDIKNLVSSMIDLVPIRIQLSKESSFADLTAQIKHTTLEAYDHARCFSSIPLYFLSQTPGQGKNRFVLRVQEHAIRFFTWLLTRLWFPKQIYHTLFYSILSWKASKKNPKDTPSTRAGMIVCLNIFPNFYKTSGKSRYICGDVVFSPAKPMKTSKSRQVNVLYFTFANNSEGHPVFMVNGMRLTPSAHQQITTTFVEVLEAVVKNPRSFAKMLNLNHKK